MTIGMRTRFYNRPTIMVFSCSSVKAARTDYYYYYYYYYYYTCACSLKAMARLFTSLEPQARIASSSSRFLLLRCCGVLLFCRLDSVFIAPSGRCFLMSSSSKCEAKCRKENQKINGKTKKLEGIMIGKGKDKGKKTPAPVPRTFSQDFLLAPLSVYPSPTNPPPLSRLPVVAATPV